MDPPKVNNQAYDSERDITYEVYAYRKLSEQELIHAVAVFVRSQKGKPKRGTRYQIMTMIGADGR
jgi:hypothetical protein